MTDGDGDPLGAQAGGDRRLLEVRSRHGVTHGPEDEGDGAHAGAPDAHDVDALGRAQVQRLRRGQRACASTSSATLAAASGCPRPRAAAPMAARRSGVGQQRPPARPPTAPRCTRRRAPGSPRPAATSASALRGLMVARRARQAAPGSPARRDASSSATVMAPARHTQQVRRPVDLGHPLFEGHHHGSADLRRASSSPHRRDGELGVVAPAGHVVQREILPIGPARGQLGHGGVDAPGAQRAAERGQRVPLRGQAEQRPSPRGAPPATGRASRARGGRGAGHHGPRELGPGERHRVHRGEPSQQPVDGSGHGVGVHQDHGDPREHGGDPGGKAGVAPDDDDDPRAARAGTSPARRQRRPRAARARRRHWPTSAPGRRLRRMPRPGQEGEGELERRATAPPPGPGVSRRARWIGPRGPVRPARGRSAGTARRDPRSRRRRSPCPVPPSPTSPAGGRVDGARCPFTPAARHVDMPCSGRAALPGGRC